MYTTCFVRAICFSFLCNCIIMWTLIVFGHLFTSVLPYPYVNIVRVVWLTMKWEHPFYFHDIIRDTLHKDYACSNLLQVLILDRCWDFTLNMDLISQCVIMYSIFNTTCAKWKLYFWNKQKIGVRAMGLLTSIWVQHFTRQFL